MFAGAFAVCLPVDGLALWLPPSCSELADSGTCCRSACGAACSSPATDMDSGTVDTWPVVATAAYAAAVLVDERGSAAPCWDNRLMTRGARPGCVSFLDFETSPLWPSIFPLLPAAAARWRADLACMRWEKRPRLRPLRFRFVSISVHFNPSSASRLRPLPFLPEREARRRVHGAAHWARRRLRQTPAGRATWRRLQARRRPALADLGGPRTLAAHSARYALGNSSRMRPCPSGRAMSALLPRPRALFPPPGLPGRRVSRERCAGWKWPRLSRDSLASSAYVSERLRTPGRRRASCEQPAAQRPQEPLSLPRRARAAQP
eukprot:gene24742-biopygen22420